MDRPSFKIGVCKAILAALFLIWVLFLVSFFLPATNVAESSDTPPGTPLTGYQAILLMLTGVGHPGVFLPFPKMLVLVPLILAANVAMVLLPVLALVSLHSVPAGCASGLICLVGIIAILQVPADLKATVFVGYYLWLVSIMAGGVALMALTVASLDADYDEP